jgi:hypothetical protein
MPTYTKAEIEQNNRWVGVWLGNTEPYYWEAQRIASGGNVEEFKDYVIKSLRDAPEDSATHLISEEMSDTDFEHGTDWADVMEYVA